MGPPRASLTSFPSARLRGRGRLLLRGAFSLIARTRDVRLERVHVAVEFGDLVAQPSVRFGGEVIDRRVELRDLIVQVLPRLLQRVLFLVLGPVVVEELADFAFAFEEGFGDLGREEDARDAEDGAADEDPGDELAPRAAAAAAVVPGARARGEVASAAGARDAFCVLGIWTFWTVTTARVGAT
jgi:hypothetical protein